MAPGGWEGGGVLVSPEGVFILQNLHASLTRDGGGIESTSATRTSRLIRWANSIRPVNRI